MTPPPGLVEAATDTRRHYAEHVFAQHDARGGHSAWPICLTAAVVEDDERRRAWHDSWGTKFVPAADLPLCQKCERKAAKR